MDEARTFSTKQRKKLANKGQAMPGGGFPIANAQDLRNAIQAFGRAKDKAAAKAHIIRRARALGLTRLLPDSWVVRKKTSKASLHEAVTLEWEPNTCLITCPEEDCTRLFIDEDDLEFHADVVHGS